MSRRFRDDGHPQYWGRIIGSSSDAQSAEWLVQKFRSIGLTDVRVQSLPIATPVWEPVQPWEIAATSGNERLPLVSAQPVYESVAAPAGALELEVVYAGTGSEFRDGTCVAKLSSCTAFPSRRQRGKRRGRRMSIDEPKTKVPQRSL